jgi:hypothetical protein
VGISNLLHFGIDRFRKTHRHPDSFDCRFRLVGHFFVYLPRDAPFYTTVVLFTQILAAYPDSGSVPSCLAALNHSQLPPPSPHTPVGRRVDRPRLFVGRTTNVAPMDRLIEICLTSMRFLPRIIAVQSLEEFAPYCARFEIRLVDGHSDKRRSRSSALRLGGHTLPFLFPARRNLPKQFRPPRRSACAPTQRAVDCCVPFGRPAAFDAVLSTRQRPRRWLTSVGSKRAHLMGS